MKCGAERGTRTPTRLLSVDFESTTSTSSVTSALLILMNIFHFLSKHKLVKSFQRVQLNFSKSHPKTLPNFDFGNTFSSCPEFNIGFKSTLIPKLFQQHKLDNNPTVSKLPRSHLLSIISLLHHHL